MKFSFFGWDFTLGRPAFSPAARPATPPPAALSPLDIIRNLAEGLLVVDRDRHVLLANDALSPLLNRPPDEAVGHPLWEVLRHREVNEMVERSLAQAAPDTREITLAVPVEAVWRVDARPLAVGAVLTFVDLTRIKRLETIRKDFVANVSHELKTPLTSLRASLETLLDGALEDPSHAREFLETAQTQVDRLQRLIEDLLALSRLEKEEQRPAAGRAALQSIARRTVAAMRPLAEKAGVTLEVSLPEAPLEPAISEDELTQVLMNLLDNAVKFNRPGGRAALGARLAAEGVEITVSDTGPGIPLQDQPRVFERFYRVDKSRGSDAGGTGLGLSIVKHIVDNRGGSLRVESVPGQGSLFTVSLPLAS